MDPSCSGRARPDQAHKVSPAIFLSGKKLRPEVSIIIPARNEEACLGECLASLVGQADVAFEIIVVDDGSSDGTGKIARSFSGVRVIAAPPLFENWTGKNNALAAGARAARAPWLLFTDADTVHRGGSLARALDEARRERADLLSYSPQQVVITFAERAVMPVIFAELAAEYPPRKVREGKAGIVAANGQYILVRRAAYEGVGGHGAVASEILEDVVLAGRFRDAGFKVHFRYGGDAVRTRMYRSWAQLREGWTKNLALLFPRAERLALRVSGFWLMAWAGLAAAFYGAFSGHFIWIGLALPWLLLYGQLLTGRFAARNTLIAAAFGPPIFSYLLIRSRKAHASGRVAWKGRHYPGKAAHVSRRFAIKEERALKAGG